jgi:NAD-dependent SIR2 family protein deacetylase
VKINNTTVILGAGFSVPCGIPPTGELSRYFLDLPKSGVTPEPLQSEISRHLRSFWNEVFQYEKHGLPPSFEDHFTILDLAANSGHNLGLNYTPQKLRAIRRLSIHRVFDVLDQKYTENREIRGFIRALREGHNNSVISTNWDIVAEKQLEGGSFHYGIPTYHWQGGTSIKSDGLSLLKLHGSANWFYCDSCRRILHDSVIGGKITLQSRIFLQTRDFEILGTDNKGVLDQLDKWNPPKCSFCDIVLSARVATFSYRKALDFFQYQGVWELALGALRNAGRWVFVGYSLPPADYELRYMVKTAQLVNKGLESIRVVLKADGHHEPVDRYKQFFGLRDDQIYLDGIESWIRGHFPCSPP